MTQSVVVRVAGADDARALATLRAAWTGGDDPALERRIAAWLADEGDRRTTWLAVLAGEPAGMASLFEYRRMPRPDRPDSRWGYVSNMYVREDLRDRGIGSALLGTIVTAAEERRYARLVTSPSVEALPFYTLAGFIDPGGEDRLLVRPAGP